jgi:ferric-dicitrate binding protein FerR (iron transport regulator)
MEWLVSLPASKQRNRVTFFAFRRWYDADPSGARAWIEAEAFEPAHDPALDGYARRLSKVSPRLGRVDPGSGPT